MEQENWHNAACNSGADEINQEESLSIFQREALMDRLMGDEGLAESIIQVFLEETPKQMNELHEKVTDGDAEGAGVQAHKIKGAEANVGGEIMSAVALEMEKGGRIGDLDKMTSLLPELEKEFDLLKEAMRDG